MALVPCRQCSQSFYASCHDASCLDALCPYCEYAEPAATNAPPATPELPVRGATGADATSTTLAASRDVVRAYHPASPSHRGWR